MKIVMLAPASVIHTQRWVEALHGCGVKLVLATQHPSAPWRAPDGVRVVCLPHAGTAGYFVNVPALRRLLRSERPDLLHAHYASGYGSTAALAAFHPWLLSVWGSDVYDFPYESFVKGWWLRRNLRAADAVASTSEAMAEQVRRLVGVPGSVAVTPFGIDTAHFAPEPRLHAGLVVGTVKTLAPKYGIDTLMHAFALLVAGLGDGAAITLRIVGDGPQRAELEALSRQLGIVERVEFAGAVAHADVPAQLNGFDIFVAASRLDSESFGVAVVEAAACALPVVVTRVGGLPEVVCEGETGLVVERDDPAALAAALGRLATDAALRERLGRNGRARVQAEYEWNACVQRMMTLYDGLVGLRPGSSARQ